MATLVTGDVKHIREDLGNFISTIDPEDRPFTNEIGKVKATSTTHEWLNDSLAPANKDNAGEEGAEAVFGVLGGPKRLSNRTQIFKKTVKVSGTLQAVNTAGTSNEKSRQILKAGKELNRDIEAALVSANSTASGDPVLAGAEAWISTNALHGAGGSTAGFVGTAVQEVVDGTARPLDDVLINELFLKIHDAGGYAKQVIAPGRIKQKVASLRTGNGSWQMPADKKTIYAGVDYYVSDFGVHEIIPHHFMTKTTLIAFDKDLWSMATLRGIKKEDLAKTGDSDAMQILTEVTLECMNEAGNGKIVDIEVQ